MWPLIGITISLFLLNQVTEITTNSYVAASNLREKKAIDFNAIFRNVFMKSAAASNFKQRLIPSPLERTQSTFSSTQSPSKAPFTFPLKLGFPSRNILTSARPQFSSASMPTTMTVSEPPTPSLPSTQTPKLPIESRENEYRTSTSLETTTLLPFPSTTLQNFDFEQRIQLNSMVQNMSDLSALPLQQAEDTNENFQPQQLEDMSDIQPMRQEETPTQSQEQVETFADPLQISSEISKNALMSFTETDATKSEALPPRASQSMQSPSQQSRPSELSSSQSSSSQSLSSQLLLTELSPAELAEQQSLASNPFSLQENEAFRHSLDANDFPSLSNDQNSKNEKIIDLPHSLNMNTHEARPSVSTVLQTSLNEYPMFGSLLLQPTYNEVQKDFIDSNDKVYSILQLNVDESSQLSFYSHSDLDPKSNIQYNFPSLGGQTEFTYRDSDYNYF